MDDMIDALEKDSGRKFLSKTHRLIKDRDFLLISPLNQSNDQVFYVSDDQAKMEKPIHLTFEKTERTADFRFSTHQHAADLDYDKLAFPLILRHWREGEYFQPLGMNGLKKLSDFFIDEKYSIPEKESVWILSSGNQPVWVVGKRIDERYKITSNTRKVFRIRFMP
jgi:tRNA(Ile)-lysidine synthase